MFCNHTFFFHLSDPWSTPCCSSFLTRASVNTCLPWTGCESALTVYLCVCRCVVHVCDSVDVCALKNLPVRWMLVWLHADWRALAGWVWHYWRPHAICNFYDSTHTHSTYLNYRSNYVCHCCFPIVLYSYLFILIHTSMIFVINFNKSKSWFWQNQMDSHSTIHIIRCENHKSCEGYTLCSPSPFFLLSGILKETRFKVSTTLFWRPVASLKFCKYPILKLIFYKAIPSHLGSLS